MDQLIRSGVPVDGLGDKLATPLLFALLANNPVGVEALLKRGADPNHRIDGQGLVGGFPIILYLAGTERGNALLELMLKYGANPDTRYPPSLNDAPEKRYEGDSLLIRSVMSLQDVKTIVKYGADINWQPHDESTTSTGGAPAVVEAAGLGQFAVVEYLVEHGARDLDAVAHTLQARAWTEQSLSRRLKILAMVRARGGKIYSGYKPVLRNEITLYQPNGTPADWISPGFYRPEANASEKPVVISDWWLKRAGLER
ncbi:ankyrin repeat domain-containing protein [Uliginosibacterium sp. sgz301328]|uniref:ankyrin repeat domain-containing protein n=1 Tax=Uliginosibacterium sp. sgz301328 TaxID=3243764 RepID=UPI00359D0814